MILLFSAVPSAGTISTVGVEIVDGLVLPGDAPRQALPVRDRRVCVALAALARDRAAPRQAGRAARSSDQAEQERGQGNARRNGIYFIVGSGESGRVNRQAGTCYM